jgi:hypothetical protein
MRPRRGCGHEHGYGSGARSARGGIQHGEVSFRPTERSRPACVSWVVHSGRDQVIEVDIFDLEDLSHVGAASAQQRRYPGLVLLPIEPGGNSLRRKPRKGVRLLQHSYNFYTAS